MAYRCKVNCKYDITFWQKTSLWATLKSFLAPTENQRFCQQGRENIRQLCQCEQIVFNNKAYIRWKYKYLQQKTLTEKYSVHKGVLQKAVMNCTAILLWSKSLKNTCWGFNFTQFAGLQTVTLQKWRHI